ncbi:isochorismatase family protein [Alkalihalobacillus sp. LMS6]|uniref:isochorismatase family protein n=1 Tax=Alkalihalobacillus sp. LMS6 TaxID=2924034 RepID=UPI0020D0512F|nr:isochorismatase family protein [Alkalihalobacillus sp. LMS6]UTR06684.1 isochorismatase family protein [Alkalihalobacillus sp. LMS6]
MNQVLLIIDTQKDLVEGSHVEQGVFQKDLLLRKINLLIQKARELAVPVIFIRDKDVAEGEGDGFDVHPEINRASSDVCFDKEATNAFYQTGLLDYLKQHQVGHLVIAGCKTEHCIDTAVRTATVNGFDVTLAGDAHSTSNSDVLSANQIIAHHNVALHGHYNVDHFSVVREVEEDLFTPSHDTYR